MEENEDRKKEEEKRKKRKRGNRMRIRGRGGETKRSECRKNNAERMWENRKEGR